MNFRKHSTEQVFSSIVASFYLLERMSKKHPLFESACLTLMELQNEFIFRVGEYDSISFPYKGKVITISNKE